MEILIAYHAKASFDLVFSLQLAILHDTLEDTATDFEEIKNEFGDRMTSLQAPPKHWDPNKIADYLDVAKMIYTALENRNRYLNNRLKKKISEYEQYTR